MNPTEERQVIVKLMANVSLGVGSMQITGGHIYVVDAGLST